MFKYSFYSTRMHNTTNLDTKWTIRANYSWQIVGGGGGSNEVSIQVNLNNMLMNLDAANPPFFFWNPDNPPPDSQRKVKFTLTDEQRNTVQVKVKVYGLDRNEEDPPLRTYTTEIVCPTVTPFEWVWDGTDDNGIVQPTGIYPYDVQVIDVGGTPGPDPGTHPSVPDTDGETSAFLSIGEINPAILDFNSITNLLTLRVGIALYDTFVKDASEVKVEVYDADLVKKGEGIADPNNRKTNLPGTLPEQLIWDYITLDVDLSAGCVPHLVVSAKDDHTDREKGHRFKPALEKGIIDKQPPQITLIATADPITAFYSDDHAGIAVNTVNIIANDTDVTSAAVISESSLSLDLSVVLWLFPELQHIDSVKVEVRDKIGNLAVASVKPLFFVPDFDDPNEANVTVGYFLCESATVRLKVYDGVTLVRTIEETKPFGEQTSLWDARDDNGEFVDGESYTLKAYRVMPDMTEVLLCSIDPDIRYIPLGYPRTRSFKNPHIARFRVYVPTEGSLTVSVSGDPNYTFTVWKWNAPNNETSMGSASSGGSITIPVGPGGSTSHGWFCIHVYRNGGPSGPINLSTEFVQVGVIDNLPWVGWWWRAEKNISDQLGHLYDPGGPLEKYDRYFGTTARQKEMQYTGTGHFTDTPDYTDDDWFGHCHGFSAASLSEPEPRSNKTVTNASGEQITFTVSDLKGLLVAAYGAVNDPAGGLGEHGGNSANDPSAKDFHHYLFKWIRRQKKGLTADLDVTDARYFHPVWKYEATMKARMVPHPYRRRMDVECKFFWMQYTATHRLTTPEDYNNGTTVRYWLEFDTSGNAIDGGWLNDDWQNVPDYMYAPFRSLGCGQGDVTLPNVNQIINAP
jgi:hypothetical protein